jgi:hypothetical protein
MRLNVIALTITTGLLWGAAVLLTTVANAIWPPYGQAFLDLAASIYPGYNAGPTIGQIIIGTIYALVDGAVGGLLFGWIYNSTLKCCPGKTA